MPKTFPLMLFSLFTFLCPIMAQGGIKIVSKSNRDVAYVTASGHACGQKPLEAFAKKASKHWPEKFMKGEMKGCSKHMMDHWGIIPGGRKHHHSAEIKDKGMVTILVWREGKKKYPTVCGGRSLNSDKGHITCHVEKIKKGFFDRGTKCTCTSK